MPHYKVLYTLDENNNHVYPESVEGIEWKSVVYHYTDNVMVGETDTTLNPDEKEVISLTAAQARNLKKKYYASYPPAKDTP